MMSLEFGIWQLGLVFIWAALAYPASLAIYNIYFHPLSTFPGPKLWAAFRFTYVRAIWRGSHVYEVSAMHQRYGPIVRTAPDELSFASAKAWRDIHCFRYGHQPFPKNPLWWGELPGRVPSIVSTPSQSDHTRARRLLSYCMTPRAVHAQEPTLQHYTDLLVRQLKERCMKNKTDGKSTVVNIVDWMTFTVFDIIGDLGFGESFHCLEDSKLHSWIAEIFSYFKVGAFVVTLRYYSALYDLFMWSIPSKTMNAANQNFSWGVEKVHRRMNLEVQREDFMKTILQRNEDSKDKGMSLEEIESNMNVVIIAGSETCGTVLSGTVNYLVRTPDALNELTEEVRNTFSNSEEITLAKLKTMPYLNAVIEEGLRMCPPNPGGLHHIVPAGGDFVCEEWLPEGMQVSVHQYSLTRSSAFFHQPDNFCPARWLPSATTNPNSPFKDDKLEVSQAFSMGSWSCIGKYLAYQELRLILAKLVWHFDLNMELGKNNTIWTEQKVFALVEKAPFDVRLVNISPD